MIWQPVPRIQFIKTILSVFACVLTNCSQQSSGDDHSTFQRTAWITGCITGSPEPPLPYVAQPAFPALKFQMCVDLVITPTNERWFLVEQFGKIYSFENRDNATQADLVIDLAREIPGVEQTYSIAFHPEFAENRYCYICYIKAADQVDGTHVARFTVSDTSPPTIDVASEVTLVTWYSGGHNGCHLLFGPDGYLYISAGDANAANPPDIFKTGQDLSDIPASILRIDVNHADPGRNYRIPPDNPFVGMEDVREEIWAYGLRNPWRMSFDRQTGDLWCGDVGWEVWEMLHRIECGGNYGWSIVEGHQPLNQNLKPGPTPILPPVTVHPHTESTSITEGLSYYGSQLPELLGVHIYSDYDTGKFWGLRYSHGKVLERRELADTTHRVVSFSQGLDGEFFFLDHIAGTIHKLIPNEDRGRMSRFPLTLSQTGLFSSVADQSPAPGVYAYTINAEPWADFATANRFLAIPGSQSINNQSSAWVFPKDSVLVKSLAMEVRSGDASSRRLIETQILHFDGNDWMPYSYRWNQQQTDAALVSATGAVENIEIAIAPGKMRNYAWRYAGRSECQRCHNKYSGSLLGFNIPQLHQPDSDSQLDRFAALKLLSDKVPNSARVNLVDPNDQSVALDSRARSYLHVNCAHCHRMSAGGAVAAYMHFDLPLEKTNMLDVPTQGSFGIDQARVISPGNPLNSVLLYRLCKLGGGRMPRIGACDNDLEGIALISQWIASLGLPDQPSDLTSLQPEYASRLNQLVTECSTENVVPIIEQLLNTTSGALAVQMAIDQHRISAAAKEVAIRIGTQHSAQVVRDLFEKFLPEEMRVQRLGALVEPESILSLQGDIRSGSQLILENSSLNCKNCHRIGNVGTEVGPDLTQIGSRLTIPQILESILQPSRQIDAKYQVRFIETLDGQVISGILIEETDAMLVLRDARNEHFNIEKNNIVSNVPSSISMMPEQSVSELTAQQLADIIAFLSSQKKK